MTQKGLAVFRATGALLLTGALVIGVPALLVTLVGNPLPSSMPSVDELRILLTQNGEGFSNFLIGVLAVLIWAIWAQLVLAVLVEAVSTARHVETRRLPTFPGVQAVAARLVGAIMLAATLTAGPLLVPVVGALDLGEFDAGEVHAPAVVDVRADGHRAGQTSLTGPATSAVLVSAKTSPVTQVSNLFVAAEETELWDLAEAAYGDGMSWKLIAQANSGSQDSNGLVLSADTATVASGTELVLPGVVDGDALAVLGSVTIGDSDPAADRLEGGIRRSAISRSSTSDASATAEMHVVEAGESLWTIAEAEVAGRGDVSPSDAEVAQYWSELVDNNRDVPSGDVDLIFPGDEVAMPSVELLPDPVVGDVPEVAEPVADADLGLPEVSEAAAEPDLVVALPEVLPDSPAEQAVGEDRGDEGPGAEQDRADEDRADDGPGTELDRAEQDRAEEDLVAEESRSAEGAPGDEPTSEQPPAFVAQGLAGFGGAMLAAGVLGAVRRRRDIQRRTRPQGAIARPHSNETAAFEAALIHASDQVVESGQGAGWRMLPVGAVAALRTAGPLEIHANASGRLHAVTVDPVDADEPVQRVELEATLERSDIEALLRRTLPQEEAQSCETESPAAPTTLLVGTDPNSGEAVLLDLASVDGVLLVGDDAGVRRFARTALIDLAVSARADDLYVIGIDVGEEIDALERVRVVPSFAEALATARRCGHTSSESPTPLVVVSPEAPKPGDHAATALRALGAHVVAPGIESQTQIVIERDRATLLPAGTVVELAAFDDAQYRSVAELVDTTGGHAFELVDESVVLSGHVDVSSSDAGDVEPGPIDVKVLGPVEVTGAAPFSSLKAVDVIAYLAFHRNGVDADQIKAWVWPTFSPPTDKAFANVMSRARTGLGADEDGAPYLSRAGADKTYRLSAAVTSDFDRFRAIVERADAAATKAETIALLRQALELVRGVPFTGGAASSFAWADNRVRAQLEYAIDEAVHRCADLAIEEGELTTARWASLKGLELVPGCEQCYRRRFLVASAGRNRTELRRAMADLERTAAAELGEPEAVDTISDELLELYQELDRSLIAGTQ